MTDHPAAIAERERIVAWLDKTADGLEGRSRNAGLRGDIMTAANLAGAFVFCYQLADKLRKDHITQSGGRGDG